MRKMLIFFLFILFSVTGLIAQDLGDTLEQLSGTAAEAYVGPIVSGFGVDINGGWYHKAPATKILGFTLEVGVVVMATPLKDEDDHFNTSGNFYFNRQQAETIADGIDPDTYDPAIYDYIVDAIMEQQFTVGMSGPTIIGPSDEEIVIEFPDQPIDVVIPSVGTQTLDLPGTEFPLGVGGILTDFNYMPLVAPQLKFGTIYGTRFTLRYLPTYEIQDLGDIDYMGFGIQHNPKVWIPYPIPVDVGLAFFTQSLDIAGIMTTKSTSYGINVSKTFGLRMLSWTPYAGFMAENCKMEFKYDYILEYDLVDPEVRQISFELESPNSSRLTIGSNFRLGVFNLNFDYNIGTYNSMTAGFALAF
ncbi:MAG: hypothetical protein K9N06_08340 [Candidatus Cloacimonetes bacterium]|nr:hypothetical protein [Candidatus Cloacimonadota bacterium]